MNTETSPSTEFYYLFQRVVAKYNALEKMTRDYGSGVDLYPAEIHSVCAIGDNPKVHMAELARVLGVTRGSIQQMVGKLQSKGLVEKFRDERDQKKIFLRLTPMGEAAYQGHEQYHAELTRYLEDCFEKLGDRDTNAILQLFETIEVFLEAYYGEKCGEAQLESATGT